MKSFVLIILLAFSSSAKANQSVDDVVAKAKEVLETALSKWSSYSPAYKNMLDSCFDDRRIGRLGPNEHRTCYANNANGFYNRPSQKIFICDKALAFSDEEAAWVYLHECGHHCFGASESTADRYATEAILDYRRLRK
jgi:hypothetical protein